MSQPDWADAKARDILGDVARCKDTAACLELIAARLRLIRVEAVTEGVDQARAVFDEVFTKTGLVSAAKPKPKLELVT